MDIAAPLGVTVKRFLVVAWLFIGVSPALVSRVGNPLTFSGRGIPSGGVAPPSNIPDILGRRALPAWRRAPENLSPDFQLGTLAVERYAFVVTGASGGDPYAQKYDKWRVSLLATLREKFGYPDDHLFVLAESESDGVGKATRDNVQRVLGDLQRRLTKDDLLLVLLIGHGTSFDGDEAKFNLVGPDLSAGEWSELLNPIPGRVVFVDTTAASFPFMRTIAGRGRVVLTATDSAA